MKNILIVDDHIAILDTLSDQLTGLNYQCFTSSSASEATATLERYRINLVISDYQLSKEQTGEDLLVLIKSRYPEIPFVIMTGNSDPRLHINLKEQGVDAFLEKPFTKKMIELMLSRINKRK